MESFTKYIFSTFLLFLILFEVTITSTTARPQDMSNDVAAAIRFLEQLDNKHGQYARPRFEYLTQNTI